MKTHLMGKVLAAVAAVTCFAVTVLAQTPASKPEFADSWRFMQEQMPGVPESLLEAACKQGVVMIYHGTWVDAQEAQIAGFKRRFPCMNVQTFSADTGQRQARWLAETHAGRGVADVIQDTDPGFLDAQAASKTLLNYQISNDQRFTAATRNKGYWYPLRAALVGIAWNTDLVSEQEAMALTSWQAVTDSRWKGRAAVVDPTAGGVAYLPWYLWRKKFGVEFIKKIGELHPRVIAAIVPAAASLASGDISLILNASETGLLPLYAKGAPIRWSLPQPGIGPMTGQAISSLAPHPAAAKLYQEYAFTEEGYGLWQRLGGAPARIGFKDQRPVAHESWYAAPKTFYAYDSRDATESLASVLETFRTYIGDKR